MTAYRLSPRPTDLGLPTDDLRGSKLTFNAATSTLAVGLWVERDGAKWGRIYLRAGTESSTYQLVGAPAPHFSDSHPTTNELGRFLYFVRDVAFDPSDARKRNFVGVGRVDLRSRAFEVLATQSMRQGAQFVAELLSVSSVEDVVHAVVGNYLRETEETSYWIARVTWSADRVDLLCKLPAVFA